MAEKPLERFYNEWPKDSAARSTFGAWDRSATPPTPPIPAPAPNSAPAGGSTRASTGARARARTRTRTRTRAAARACAPAAAPPAAVPAATHTTAPPQIASAQERGTPVENRCPVLDKAKSSMGFNRKDSARQCWQVNSDAVGLLEHCREIHKFICPICELRLDRQGPQSVALGSVFFDEINYARAHVRCIHLKPWFCGCGKRFGAAAKLNQHLKHSGCPIRLNKFFSSQMELLNKDLKDAKTTEDLRSILLPNGEPIYDYTGGPDARVDMPPPPPPPPAALLSASFKRADENAQPQLSAFPEEFHYHSKPGGPHLCAPIAPSYSTSPISQNPPSQVSDSAYVTGTASASMKPSLDCGVAETQMTMQLDVSTHDDDEMEDMMVHVDPSKCSFPEDDWLEMVTDRYEAEDQSPYPMPEGMMQAACKNNLFAKIGGKFGRLDGS